MKKSKTPSAGEYGEKQELTQTDGGSSASCSNYLEGFCCIWEEWRSADMDMIQQPCFRT